jgi:hypothetical protein
MFVVLFRQQLQEIPMSLSRSRIVQFVSSIALAPIAALTLVSAPAAAAEVVSHGAGCNPYGSSTGLVYTESGVWNLTNATISVVCSIPRLSVPGAGQAFVVEGQTASDQAISCAIRTFDDRGAMVASKAFTTTGNIQFQRTLVFSAAELPTNGPVSMVCTLGPRGGYIRAIHTSTPTQLTAQIVGR